MADKLGRLTPDGQHPLHHGLAFLVSGCTAFAVDATVLTLLVALLGLHPIAARLFAISLALIAGWLMHRTFTFRTPTRPSAAEFLRYAGVAWTSSAINYALFVLIVLMRPLTEPLVALLIASAAAMVFAYFGMRFLAFRRPDAGSQG